MASQTESFVDDGIDVPADVPSNILDILKKLEFCDKEGNAVGYWDRLDDLVIFAKNAIAAGVLSKKSWEALEMKYWRKALLACGEE